MTSASFPTSPAQKGLSTGAKAGIGVGTSIGVIGLTIIVGLFFRQGKHSKALKRDSATSSAFEKPELGPGKAEMVPTGETSHSGEETQVKVAGVSELEGK